MPSPAVMPRERIPTCLASSRLAKPMKVVRVQVKMGPPTSRRTVAKEGLSRQRWCTWMLWSIPMPMSRGKATMLNMLSFQPAR